MPKCKPHICALIPTYNNASTILDVVRRTHAFLRDIIVVVDGATDNTSDLLATLDFSVSVIAYPHNQGKGAALKRGFRYALEQDFDYALTLDADGQHFPEDIPLLLDKLAVHPDSLIVGARQLQQENMPKRNTFANRFSNFWFHLQTGLRLPDTQSGMRIYPLHRLGHFRFLTSRYESELELLVFAAWRNVPIYAVPVHVYYPPEGQRVSHFRPFYDFSRISLLNTFLCLLALIYGLPSRYWRSVYCMTAFFLASLWCKCSRRPLTERFQRSMRWVLSHLAGNRFQVLNPLQIAVSSPVMFVANHTSMYDVLAILAFHPQTLVLTKGWISHNPFFGSLATQAGFLSVDEGIDNLLPRLRQAVADGYSLLFFPEGARSMDGDIHRFHRGACFIAKQLSLPIQPVLFRGMYEVLSKAEFRLGKADITMELLPPLSVEDTTFGTDYRARTCSLQHYYHALLRVHSSVLVMGGGIGGLFTAALLAKHRFRVTVLEQLPALGGGFYSFEKDGCWWQTGLHMVPGLEQGGLLRQVLDELNISVPFVKNLPNCIHGNASAIDPLALLYGGERCGTEQSRSLIRSLFSDGAYRLVGGAYPLASQLCAFIVLHGGRVLFNQKITAITLADSAVTSVQTESGETFTADIYVSSLHPKQLIRLASKPVFRPVAEHRIWATEETFGTFKLFVRLRPNSFHYLPENHFVLPEDILVFTPCVSASDRWATTLEIILPLSYSALSAWHQSRDEAYLSFKHDMAEQVLDRVATYFPMLRDSVLDYFTATSLTYRDDFLTPEGGMYGLSQPVGAVTTHCPNLFLTGQNCHYHGICGCAQTALELTHLLCQRF